METRPLGKTGRSVSIVGQGCWQLGGDWERVDDDDALAVLNAAVDCGVTFFDTADVYGGGRSESLIGRMLKSRPDARVTVATKVGRRADPWKPESFTFQALSGWVDDSRRRLGVDRLDLVQLHCPPTPVYSDDRVYEAMDTLVEQGRITAYGVSVETCAEALTAMSHPNVATVQLVLNAFRRKPLEVVLPAAAAAGVGVVARVPLASGLLTGKYDETTTFDEEDHRNYNRHGEYFDVGETFSGVPFDVGVQAARRVAALATSCSTAQLALRWLLDQPGVTVAIPGARNPTQVRGNVGAAGLEPLAAQVQETLRAIYDEDIRDHVHDKW
jgi:aryl-alcohol dehydrogenase-like predicted oxidoreductase